MHQASLDCDCQNNTWRCGCWSCRTTEEFEVLPVLVVVVIYDTYWNTNLEFHLSIFRYISSVQHIRTNRTSMYDTPFFLQSFQEIRDLPK